MTERLNQAMQLLNTAGDEFWRFSSAMFVQTTVLVGVLAVLDVLVLRRLRASVRYAVWTLVLVKLVLPVSLSSPVSLARWMPAYDAPPSEETAETPDAVVTRSVVREDKDARPADAARVTAFPVHPLAERPTDGAATVPISTNPAKAAPFNVRPASISPAAATRQRMEWPHWKTWMLASWLGVVAVLFGILMRRVLHVRRIVGRSELASGTLQATLSECLDSARLRAGSVRLRVTRDLGSPAICGFFRATIPEAFRKGTAETQTSSCGSRSKRAKSGRSI